jgi:hypothetical protein
MKRTHTVWLATALLLCVAAAPASAKSLSALGNQGQLYVLRTTTYGNVYADAADSVAEDPVLLLEIQRPDQSVETTVVPGTEGAESENSAYMAYEPSSDTVFVAWERRTNLIHSQILLAGYSDGVWSDLISVSDKRFSLKASPQLTVTRDSFVALAEDGGAARRTQRTVLHVLWYEERSEGPAIVYAPIVLINGAYVGQHESLVLNELFAPPADETGAPPLELSLAPVIAPTSDGHMVAAAYADPQTGALVTLRISLLSGEINSIAGDLRSHLIDVGARYHRDNPNGLQSLADDLRSHLIDVGVRMDPRLLDHVADDLRSHLIDVGVTYGPGPEETQRLARDLRSHLIDIGFRLENRGIRPAAVIEAKSFELLPEGDPESEVEESVVRQAAQVQLLARRQLPEIGSEARVLLSGSGEDVLITWQEGPALRFRETTDDGEWSPAMSLPLTEELSFDRALTVLGQRIWQR